MSQMTTICSLTETYQSFSISLEYRLIPFCTFVDKSKYRNNRKYENKQPEIAEDKFSAEFRKFSPYFIIEILGMCKVFHNKLSFMGAGFLIFICIAICKQIGIKGCEKHCISLLYHKEPVCIHRCNRVIVISLERYKNP